MHSYGLIHTTLHCTNYITADRHMFTLKVAGIKEKRLHSSFWSCILALVSEQEVCADRLGQFVAQATLPSNTPATPP
jgi:hypothetical protein